MESWDAINEYNRQEHLYRLNELNKKQQTATTQTNKYNFALFESLIDKITLKYAS